MLSCEREKGDVLEMLANLNGNFIQYSWRMLNLRIVKKDVSKSAITATEFTVEDQYLSKLMFVNK